jgi:hypothetical protein
VVAFQCRDAARERARPALKACRAQFRACAEACPPPNPPSEAIDPFQCKRDAKAAYRACRATCVEDFQFQKDVCATVTTPASSNAARSVTTAGSRSRTPRRRHRAVQRRP